MLKRGCFERRLLRCMNFTISSLQFFYLKKPSNQDGGKKEKEGILGWLWIGYNSLTTYMQMQLKLSFPPLIPYSITQRQKEEIRKTPLVTTAYTVYNQGSCDAMVTVVVSMNLYPQNQSCSQQRNSSNLIFACSSAIKSRKLNCEMNFNGQDCSWKWTHMHIQTQIGKEVFLLSYLSRSTATMLSARTIKVLFSVFSPQ
jgi:hypothetical protein